MKLSGDAARAGIRIVSVLIASVLLGGFTSLAQSFLPEPVASFANSASGWTLLTAVLVFWARLGWLGSALLGAASFTLLTVGYAVVSTWRGFGYDPLMFVVVGVIVGPFVGVAASWLRAKNRRAALAVALLSGIALGEAVYGLTTIGETTSPIYWIIVGGLGLVLLVWGLTRRIRGAWPIAVAVAGTAVTATVFVIAYTQLGTI